MEIKGIGGIISTYKNTRAAAPKKSGAADSTKNNTDRVEFGFAAALDTAKEALAAEVRADATPRELVDAGETARQGIDSAAIAAMIFMG